MAENIVQHLLTPNVLILARFSVQLGPVGIGLDETFFKSVVWEAAMYICLVAPPIASMCRNTFAEVLFDCWLEWVVFRQRQTRKGETRGVETPIERRGIISLRGGYLFLFQEPVPKHVDVLGLLLAHFSQVGICPGHSTVAVLLGPVAVPCGSAEVRFCSVVARRYGQLTIWEKALGWVNHALALPVTTEEKERVPLRSPGFSIQSVDVVI